METTLAPRSVISSTAEILRPLATTWAAAGMLPLPILVTTDPAASGVVSCLYLGLASGWLATEVQCFAGPPQTRHAWLATSLATYVAVGTNVCVFILFGIAAGVQTNFPFPLMATLSAAPAIGLVPWLARRVRDRFAALLFAAAALLAAKLRRRANRLRPGLHGPGVRLRRLAIGEVNDLPVLDLQHVAVAGAALRGLRGPAGGGNHHGMSAGSGQ